MPIAGSRVRLCRANSPAAELASGESDAGGRVTLRAPAEVDLDWEVEVAAAGYRSDSTSVDVDPVDSIARLAFYLRRPCRAVRITGRVVTPEGEPVVGVTVKGGGDEARTTGPIGEFDAFLVELEDDREAASVVLTVDSPVGHAESTDVAVATGVREVRADLVWPTSDRTRKVTGTVALPDGEPAVGARVEYRRKYGGPAAGPGPDAGSTHCDRDGRFALRVPTYFLGCCGETGNGSLFATLPGYGWAVEWVPHTQGHATAHLRLRAARVTTGRITDAQGEPIVGARVELCGPSLGSAPLPTEAGSAAKGEDSVDEPWVNVVAIDWADAAGAFEFSDVPIGDDLIVRAWFRGDPLDRRTPQHWRDFARAWKSVSASSYVVDLAVPWAASGSEVQVDEADEATVRLRLVDMAGRPFSASISEVDCRVGEDSISIDVTVDDDVVEVPSVPRGSVRLRLASEDLSPIEVDVDTSSGAAAYERTVCVPDGASIRVRLDVPAGLTSDDITLRLVSVDDGDVVRAMRHGADGTWSATRVTPGRWRIDAEVLGDAAWGVAGRNEVSLVGTVNHDVALTLARGAIAKEDADSR